MLAFYWFKITVQWILRNKYFCVSYDFANAVASWCCSWKRNSTERNVMFGKTITICAIFILNPSLFLQYKMLVFDHQGSTDAILVSEVLLEISILNFMLSYCLSFSIIFDSKQIVKLMIIKKLKTIPRIALALYHVWSQGKW